MKKTTVYLPDELKQVVAQIAAETGRSEADVIRQAIIDLAHARPRPRPTGSLFESGDPSLSSNVDEALVGFGDR